MSALGMPATIIAKALDKHVRERSTEELGVEEMVDTRLQGTVEATFRRCIKDGEYKQAPMFVRCSRDACGPTDVSNVTAYRCYPSWWRSDHPHLPSCLLCCVLARPPRLQEPLYLVEIQCPENAIALLWIRAAISRACKEHLYYPQGLKFSCTDGPTPDIARTEGKLLAYQFTFDLVKDDAQDFLESIRKEHPGQIYNKLRGILLGQESIKLYLVFLKHNNKVDMLLLKNAKEALKHRISIYHIALTFRNAFIHSGTTSATSLHENLECLASNWFKFSATAVLCVIHWGHLEESMNILGPYFLSQGTTDATSTEEMLMYVHETQHEKIIRDLAAGLAFIFYGDRRRMTL
ncbi:26S proteasome non-ATPase regulatory subunit 1 A [Grifola frondosa]|uniref:26S proteasome non-ATPase regulatory subunit 1 A n=1 Tax=Grifola frondosa TaxID=5627 RepID=A0A1C7LRQ5_GRIFR|nr:26S proteasome non-ATPase regulatory subunit 1 A [Grifola frondosa]